MLCHHLRPAGASFSPKLSQSAMAAFPYKQVVVVALVLFANNFGSLMIFPILPFMIHDFFPSIAPSQIGNYGGFLASAFYLGSFSGSLMWGRLADRYGRKAAMLAGIIGTTVSILLFGTSLSFFWAISARFLWGFLNGNVGVAKAYLSEILASQDQARGFSFMGVSRGAGRFVGPVAGGFLSCPAVKFPSFDNVFFRKFPYFLPCLMGVLICGCCFAGAVLYLKETLTKHTNESSERTSSDEMELVTMDYDAKENQGFVSDRETTPAGEQSNFVASSDPNSDRHLPTLGLPPGDITELHTAVTCVREGSSLCERSNQEPVEYDDETDDVHFGDHGYQKRWSSLTCDWCTCFPSRERSYHHLQKRRSLQCLGSCRCSSFTVVAGLMKEKSIAILVFMFGMMSFGGVLFMEVVPLLLVMDYRHGGFMLDSAEISLVLTVVGVGQLVFLAFIYPRIAACIGVRRFFQMALFVNAVTMVFVPFMTSLTGDVTAVLDNTDNNRTINVSLAHDKPTRTLQDKGLDTSTENVFVQEFEETNRKMFSRYEVLRPSFSKVLSGATYLQERTLVSRSAMLSSFTSPYKATSSLLTGNLYLTMSPPPTTVQLPAANATSSSMSTSQYAKTSVLRLRPTKVQTTSCGSCSSSVHVSTSPEHAVNMYTSPSPPPEIPVGQCKFDVQSGNKTAHLTVSQVPMKVWAVSGITIAANFVTQMSCFTCINILIGNSCERSVRGTVFGLTQTAGSLGRFLAPMVGGSVFAWSQRNGLSWPLNFHFLFYCLAGQLVMLFILSTRLPLTIEKQKEEVVNV